MVKRLRRHPLTVESGVRVPLGVPNKHLWRKVLFLTSSLGDSLCANKFPFCTLHLPNKCNPCFHQGVFGTPSVFHTATRRLTEFHSLMRVPLGVPNKHLWRKVLFLTSSLGDSLCANKFPFCTLHLPNKCNPCFHQGVFGTPSVFHTATRRLTEFHSLMRVPSSRPCTKKTSF